MKSFILVMKLSAYTKCAKERFIFFFYFSSVQGSYTVNIIGGVPIKIPVKKDSPTQVWYYIKNWNKGNMIFKAIKWFA